MKFADMTPQERTQWLKWAWSHDWGADAWFVLEGGVVYMRGLIEAYTLNGKLYEEAAEHTDSRELRNWAGY